MKLNFKNISILFWAGMAMKSIKQPSILYEINNGEGK